MTEKSWHHIFCCNGAVIEASKCPHLDAPGEEFARLTPIEARQLQLLPDCCRWAAVQPRPNNFGCPNGHNYEQVF